MDWIDRIERQVDNMSDDVEPERDVSELEGDDFEGWIDDLATYEYELIESM